MTVANRRPAIGRIKLANASNSPPPGPQIAGHTKPHQARDNCCLVTESTRREARVRTARKNELTRSRNSRTEAITTPDMLLKVGKNFTTDDVIAVPYICTWEVPRYNQAGLCPMLQSFYHLKVAKATDFHILALSSFIMTLALLNVLCNFGVWNVIKPFQDQQQMSRLPLVYRLFNLVLHTNAKSSCYVP